MGKLLFDEAPLTVNVLLATKIGIDAAIVLQQVHYWVEVNRKKNSNFHEGYYWTYNTIKDWNKCFPFYGERTIQRIFKKLKDLGLLKVGNFNKAKFDKTSWYTIDYDVLYELVEEKQDMKSPSRQNDVIEETESVDEGDKVAESIRQNGVKEHDKVAESMRQNGVKEHDKMAEPIPEINTEITTEINTKTTTETTNNRQSEIVCASGEAPSSILSIIERWNSNIYLPKLVKLTPSTSRYKMLKTRIKEYGLEGIFQAIDNIAQSDFLQGKALGKNGKPFHLTFDWFIRPDNFPKILEGNYSNKPSNQSTNQVVYQGNGCQVEVESTAGNAFDRLRAKHGGM